MPKYQAPETLPACSKMRREKSPHLQPQIQSTNNLHFLKFGSPIKSYTVQLYENETGLCESLIFLLLSSLFNSPRITCTVQHGEMNRTNSILYSKSDPAYQSTLNRKPVKKFNRAGLPKLSLRLGMEVLHPRRWLQGPERWNTRRLKGKLHLRR